MGRISIVNLLRDQFTKLPLPENVDLTGKTVVVVGANAGLGFEASKHFARMRPGRLILACRNADRGKAAIQELAEETGYGSAELWLIDLSDFSTVKEFANKFEKDGGRLDILVENAAVVHDAYSETTDGWEILLQVNYLALSLLALLLLPIMVRTGRDYQTHPRLVVVASDLHMMAGPLKGLVDSPNIVKTFGSKEFCTSSFTVMMYRYNDTKLLNVFFARALNDRIAPGPHSVIVNSVNPGFCYSELRRDLTGVKFAASYIAERLMARTTEQGSRTLVFAALGQPDREDEMRGAYINCCSIGEAGDYVLTQQGKVAQDKIWDELVELLAGVDPRVREIVSSHLTPAAP